jgi:uncharacterized phage protein (TIGR02216 family)
MALGLGTLRLSPSSFWRMTPRELSAAALALTDATPRSTPPTRSDLAEMMRRFPDNAPRTD